MTNTLALTTLLKACLEQMPKKMDELVLARLKEELYKWSAVVETPTIASLGKLVWKLESEIEAFLVANDLEEVLTYFAEQEKNQIKMLGYASKNPAIATKFLGSEHKIDGTTKHENPLTIILSNDLMVENFLVKIQKTSNQDTWTIKELKELAKEYVFESGERYRKK